MNTFYSCFLDGDSFYFIMLNNNFIWIINPLFFNTWTIIGDLFIKFQLIFAKINHQMNFFY